MLWHVKDMPQTIPINSFFQMPEAVFDYCKDIHFQLAHGGTVNVWCATGTDVFKAPCLIHVMPKGKYVHPNKKHYVCVSLEQAKIRVRKIVKAEREAYTSGWSNDA